MSVYIDDIFISGSTVEEHLERLIKVLERLQTDNKSVKSIFLQHSLEHLFFGMYREKIDHDTNVLALG